MSDKANIELAKRCVKYLIGVIDGLLANVPWIGGGIHDECAENHNTILKELIKVEQEQLTIGRLTQADPAKVETDISIADGHRTTSLDRAEQTLNGVGLKLHEWYKDQRDSLTRWWGANPLHYQEDKLNIDQTLLYLKMMATKSNNEKAESVCAIESELHCSSVPRVLSVASAYVSEGGGSTLPWHQQLYDAAMWLEGHLRASPKITACKHCGNSVKVSDCYTIIQSLPVAKSVEYKHVCINCRIKLYPA